MHFWEKWNKFYLPLHCGGSTNPGGHFDRSCKTKSKIINQFQDNYGMCRQKINKTFSDVACGNATK